jgi:hypothetical protein
MTSASASASASVGPVVGEGATLYGWSDVRAYTVIAVSRSGNRATIQRDSCTLLNGPDSGEPDALRVYTGGFAAHVEGRQRWDIRPNPEGATIEISRRRLKSGEIVWVQVGGSAKGGSRIAFGDRHEHYDYNF